MPSTMPRPLNAVARTNSPGVSCAAWHPGSPVACGASPTCSKHCSPSRNSGVPQQLIDGEEADLLIADKAFDADGRVLAPLAAVGKRAVIPPKMRRRLPRDFDRHLYKARHLIENFFAKLKQHRAIATRYDKTARNFLAGIHLVASAIWLN